MMNGNNMEEVIMIYFKVLTSIFLEGLP